MNRKPVILIILDGWGHSEIKVHNAIYDAKTPVFDKLWQENPHTCLAASGEAVGLPEGQMGNSEVGHITIGAGKTLDTDLLRIGRDAKNGTMAENSVFLNLFDHVKKYDSTLHLLGLIGRGGVHSHEDHLIGILKAAKDHGISKIAIHAFTDGRDTPPQSANRYLKTIEDTIDDLGVGFIATASGRFFAMDRDNNWDRIKKVEDALFEAKSEKREVNKPSVVIEELYITSVLDEHLEPIVFLDQNKKHYAIEKNDGVLFFNFRADRSRQLSRKIASRKENLNLCFVTLSQYDPTIESLVAYQPEFIETTMANEIAINGLNQVHIAETEKFAHATYYLNGGKQEPHDLEKHILVDSRKDIDTHDKAPEMKAKEIADKAIENIKNGPEFIFINFANPDMVGHTGNKEATIKAIEETDRQLGRVVEVAKQNQSRVIITADHGNAENNIDADGNPHTAHTINQVPFILAGEPVKKLNNGSLTDIAPTVLALFDIGKPKSMTGQNLFIK